MYCDMLNNIIFLPNFVTVVKSGDSGCLYEKQKMMKRFSFLYLFFFIFILFPFRGTFAKSEADNTIDTSSFGKIVLTEKEQNWLAEKHVVRARVGANPPLHFFDGENKGLSPLCQTLTLIHKLIRFKLNFIYISRSDQLLRKYRTS